MKEHDIPSRYVATAEDRQHFCTYDQAQAALLDADLPFRSNGQTHVALNVSTGHQIPCADAFMAFGYVAGSAALCPQWQFVLQMGSEQVGPFLLIHVFRNGCAIRTGERERTLKRLRRLTSFG